MGVLWPCEFTFSEADEEKMFSRQRSEDQTLQCPPCSEDPSLWCSPCSMVKASQFLEL